MSKMFKVQISGRLDGKPRLKRVANRDVCNFTIRCRNEYDKDNSYVRCAIWGKKASRFFNGSPSCSMYEITPALHNA